MPYTCAFVCVHKIPCLPEQTPLTAWPRPPHGVPTGPKEGDRQGTERAGDSPGGHSSYWWSWTFSLCGQSPASPRRPRTQGRPSAAGPV